MGFKRGTLISLTLGAGLALAGCSGDGLLGDLTTTSSLPEKVAVNPQCTTLASQIDALKKDGVTERVEQAAKGKGTTVNVKRESLGKIAQLNALNTEFQNKCSTLPHPAATTASAASSGPVNVGAPAPDKTVKTAAAKSQ
jgi:hypothetical protein